MNQTVVLMCNRAKTDINFNDPKSNNVDAIISQYVRLHHMLLYLAAQDPSYGIEANRKVTEFLDLPKKRLRWYGV